jgi:hypothetical protein
MNWLVIFGVFGLGFSSGFTLSGLLWVLSERGWL